MCKRYLTFDNVFTHSLFARFAFEPRSVNDFQACKLASPESRIQQYEKGVSGIFFEICKAMLDKLFFFVVGKCRSALALVVGVQPLFKTVFFSLYEK